MDLGRQYFVLFRDAISILTFSLNAAEQSLAETVPQMVTKLQETRTKRLLKLEKDAAEAKKQIEQRSAETCIMNTAHLGEFQAKAKAKLDTATQEWNEAMTALKNLSRQHKTGL